MSLSFSLGIAIRRQTSASATVPPTLFGPPVNVTLPVITGPALVGQVLTVSMGAWMGSPTGYSVQWWRGVVAILGATAASYSLSAADVGSTISASVTAANADGSTLATSVSTVAVSAANSATVVVGIMGQSEAQYILGADSVWDAVPNAQRPVITTPNMVMINAAVDTALPGTALDYRLTPVTTETVSDLATRTVSASVGALSAALQHITPGTQYAVVDLAVSGTGRQELLTDADLFNPNTGAPARGRTWAEFEGMVNFARAQGYELDEIHESWYANDTGSIPNFLNKFGAFYMGENGNGTAANIGDVYEPPSGLETAAKTLDHILWDKTAASNAQGRGLFARDRTKLRVYLPYENMNEASVAGMLTFTGDARVQTFATPQPEISWVMGARSGWHAINNDPDGGIYTLFNYVPGFLKAAGMTVGQPEIVDTTVGPGGAYVDLTVSLPNGGNLTTIRALEGRADPASPTDDYQPVMGFEVQRAGDAIASKLAFVPPSKTSYNAKFRGTVAITDAGTGTGAARTGTVRITPEVPIASGDRLHYLSNYDATLIGGGNARRVTHKTWLDALIETVPAWRDTSAPTRYPGIPIAPLLTPMVLDATPPTANPLGTPVILNGTTGNAWASEVRNHETSAFAPSATGGLYVVAVIGDTSATGTGAAISSCTIGAAGRAVGTGTPLTLVSDVKRNRSRIAVYRLDGAPSATAQTVEMGFATPAPFVMRLLVLQIPNAAIAAPVTIDPYTWTISVPSWEHTPTVASANNGVLYIHSIVSASGNLITSASDSTEVFAGNNGGTTQSGSNYTMMRWKVPGAAGPQSETFNFAAASAQWAGVAIQIAPKP